MRASAPAPGPIALPFLVLLLAFVALSGCKRESVRAVPVAGPPRAGAGAPPRPAPPAVDRDGGPASAPDLSHVREPVPRAEPRAAYGNKSPYTVLGRTYEVLPSSRGYVERGIASWYGTKFHGRLTSSREPYDMYAVTAAHKTLPLPTFARVTNLDNGKSIVVRINDRGPFHAGRIIDLSYAAAVKLGIHATGTGRVEVRALDTGVVDLRSVVSAPAQGTTRATAPRAHVAASEPRRSSRAPVGATEPRRSSRGATSGRLFVQVGSFSDRDNAKRVEDRLEDADVDDVFLDRARIDGRTVHRVRIGPFERPSDAQALLAHLRGLGFTSVITAAE